MFKYLTTVGGIQHAGLVTQKNRKRIEKHVEIIAVRETGLTSVSESELYGIDRTARFQNGPNPCGISQYT